MKVINSEGRPIKMWTEGVHVADNAIEQLKDTAKMPFIHKWLAVMPDVHLGRGSTVGSVIPTKGAIIPAAVGVDIGCGMMALRTSLTASDLPDDLKELRYAIERAVPHGRSNNGGLADKGGWKDIPTNTATAWDKLSPGFSRLLEINPRFSKTNNVKHLGTLGSGNHFVEVCLDTVGSVWIMLHSGSRGVGNAIGSNFIEKARNEMKRWMVDLPNEDLAYLPEGSQHFDDYVFALEWAQQFAQLNREVMMENTIKALQSIITKPFEARIEAINCHHNYVSREHHYGEDVFVTRKGAVKAGVGDMGIIPGSMGAKSFIVRGLGNAESFCSCSHGAGRVMSRTQAKKEVSMETHLEDIKGVECRKDEGVIDETPSAYKDIDKVMSAQSDLVEVVHTLKQVLCVKG